MVCCDENEYFLVIEVVLFQNNFKWSCGESMKGVWCTKYVANIPCGITLIKSISSGPFKNNDSSRSSTYKIHSEGLLYVEDLLSVF